MPSPAKTRPTKPAKEGQLSKPSASRKRQPTARISAACEACKKRRSKCTGEPTPCQLCNTLGTECVIDLALDMRRRTALQHARDESKFYRDTLNGLIDSIREDPSSVIDKLVENIRNGATSQEICGIIQHHTNNIGSQGLDHEMQTRKGFEESHSEETKCETISVQTQTDRSLTHEEAKDYKVVTASGLGTVALELGKIKETDVPHPVSALLAELKSCSPSTGEDLLRRFLALQAGDKNPSPPWSELNNGTPSDGMGRSIGKPCMAERIQWRSALHLRSGVNASKEQLQVSRKFCVVRGKRIWSVAFDVSVHNPKLSKLEYFQEICQPLPSFRIQGLR
jgi:hypothetical protein